MGRQIFLRITSVQRRRNLTWVPADWQKAPAAEPNVVGQRESGMPRSLEASSHREQLPRCIGQPVDPGERLYRQSTTGAA